uniref:Uncharacterized protein n=1 Tax=Candidatus Kentrum sp. LFY TaxID=2126342 RepID=A0A450V315_9GAMM|nr:MAG: hypothetical protein BECKLFY1418A_GA0070994_10953 [Candidatus Kentron sp. LFY]
MANSGKRSLGEKLNTWVQTIAILAAGLWGAYVFIYQEFWLPKSSPTSVTLDVSLRKAGKANHNNGPLEAIELLVLAKNTTKYPIELLPSIFVVHGLEFVAATLSDENAFDRNLESKGSESAPITPHSGKYRNRHSIEASRTEISIGSPFFDTRLNPGETIKRTFIITIPGDEYDALKASVIVPRCSRELFSSSCEEKRTKLEWGYNKEKQQPESVWCQDGKCTVIEKDDYKSRKIRRAISKVMLSL